MIRIPILLALALHSLSLWGQCPTITSIGSNSPVLAGQTLNLTSSSIGATSYSWSGPGGFTALVQNPTRPNATVAMSGTYTLTAVNAQGCAVTRTVTVVVEPDCCAALAGNRYQSHNNHTGSWTSGASWSPPYAGAPAFPAVSPFTTQPICVNGYITYTGNLAITQGTQLVCDTLVITGNLDASSHHLTVAPTGVLVVLGSFTGANGTMNNHGVVVTAGSDFHKPFSYNVDASSGDFYIFDPTPFIESNNPNLSVGNEDSLAQNHPSLYEFVTGLLCPTRPTARIAGGTTGNVCEGDAVSLLIQLTGTPPFTLNLADGQGNTWSRTLSAAQLTGSNPYTYTFTTGAPAWVAGQPPVRVHSYRIVSASDSSSPLRCRTARVLGGPNPVTVHKIPETGAQVHVPNQASL